MGREPSEDRGDLNLKLDRVYTKYGVRINYKKESLK